MKLENKIALISGSSRGIGKSIAEKFASEGAQVIVTYKDNYKLAKSISEKLDDSMIVKWDISSKTSITDAIKNISARSIELKSMHDKLKNDIVSTVDTERQDAIRTDARRISNENVILKKDITNLKELQKEYKYIKSIKTFVDFCDAIRLGKLDNEEGMIALVERLLNILMNLKPWLKSIKGKR